MEQNEVEIIKLVIEQRLKRVNKNVIKGEKKYIHLMQQKKNNEISENIFNHQVLLINDTKKQKANLQKAINWLNKPLN